MSSNAFTLPPEIENAVKDIANDHESGARQLALKALYALKLATTLFPADIPSWPKIVNCAWHIVQARPSMKPAIETAILRALDEIQPPVYPSLDTTASTIDNLISEESKTLDRICEHFRQLIEEYEVKSILTLSNSSTIFAALKDLFEREDCPEITLTILESRPLFEGVTLAKSLLPFKPPHVIIELAIDAAAAHYASKSQLVIIGADQVDPFTGNIKNKVGSCVAAKFAPMHECWCMTSTDKLAPKDGRKEWSDNFNREWDEDDWQNHDTSEMTSAWPGVEGGERWVVRNMYFEWVPSEDVAGYITEKGNMGWDSLEDIYRERESWKEVWTLLDEGEPDGNKRKRNSRKYSSTKKQLTADQLS